MKKTKSEELYDYVMGHKKVKIENIFKTLDIKETQFNRLKFKIKENHTIEEFEVFLDTIIGPKMLLLANPIHIEISDFIINNNANKQQILDHYNMTSNEFTTMLQNLKKHDRDKYNKVLSLCKKPAKEKKEKAKKLDMFNEITNFIILNNCGYYEVCKKFAVSDAFVKSTINGGDKYISDNVKKVLKANRASDKLKFKTCKDVFSKVSNLKTLKKLIIRGGYCLTDLAVYFSLRYDDLNKFIKNDLKKIDANCYTEINNYLSAYKKYLKVLEYCLNRGVNYALACDAMNLNYVDFVNNLKYLKYTDQYKKLTNEEM